MPNRKSEILLTILVTVVSGKDSVRRNLKALYPQVDFSEMEIIIPFDQYSETISELAAEFPEVKFHYLEDLGIVSQTNISARAHRLYDLRRTEGLKISRGRIIAQTEDNAEPAEDWVRQILLLHELPYDVIGGAIENGLDTPLNWAWYYCDFGRFGKPFKNKETHYISDTNVAYKREALFAVFDVWDETYQETSVHVAMKSRGIRMLLNERMVVYQKRPPLTIYQSIYERITWGLIFAEVRAKEINIWKRLVYIVGTPVLPALLIARAIKNMRRQKRTLRQMISILPIVFFLLVGWSFGELIGYIKSAPKINHQIQT